MNSRIPDSSGEGFLRRLHRRKQAAREGLELPDEPPVEETHATEPEPVQPVLSDEDMPPVDELKADSDFSPFLSPGVSESLQREALRRLWQVADLEFVDDLDIYASDYTEFEPLGALVTREMRHRMELETARQAQQLLAEEPQTEDLPDKSEDERLAAADRRETPSLAKGEDVPDETTDINPESRT